MTYGANLVIVVSGKEGEFEDWIVYINEMLVAEYIKFKTKIYIVVNKLDTVGNKQERFEHIKEKIQ